MKQALGVVFCLFFCLCPCPLFADAFTRAADQAQEAYEEGDYPSAIPLYLSAYAARPVPRILLPLGRSYLRTLELQQGIETLQRYLETSAVVSPVERIGVEQEIVTARAQARILASRAKGCKSK